jgi:hypothetical protein
VRVPVPQRAVIDDHRAQGNAAGSAQPLGRDLAVRVDDALERLVQVLNRARTPRVHHPTHAGSGVWLGRRATPGGDHAPPGLDTGGGAGQGMVMLVAQPRAHLRRPCRQPGQGVGMSGNSGGGQVGGQGPLDRGHRRAQRPRPPRDPAVPARRGPVRLGITRGVRDDAGLAILLVPPAPRARSTVRSMAAARPQLAQGCSIAPSARPRQPRGAGPVVGMAWRRRSPVRRVGKRPSTVNTARHVGSAGVG